MNRKELRTCEAHRGGDILMTIEELTAQLRALAPLIEWEAQRSGRIVAIIDDMEIDEPFLSTCGRFSVSPQDEYGIPQEAALLLDQHNRNFHSDTGVSL